MQQEDAETLLNKYRDGTATQEEVGRLLHWIQTTDFDHQIDITVAELELADKAMWQNINPHINAGTVKLWPRLIAAASVIIIIGLSGILLFRRHPPANVTDNNAANIRYGAGKAILKIGNGKSIILDDNAPGVLAKQGHTSIVMNKNGQVEYAAGNAAPDANPVYDTIQNPAGGNIHHIKLKDGTILTLNAATTLIFPENFSKKERQVKLITGEAYFEVAHNADIPFRVLANGQLVEDIGTHFNISAYQAEPVITTLLEGSVRISHKGQTAVLIPGQKAVTQSTTREIIIDKADTDESIAWAQGLFMFNDERLEDIMKQVSRWYNAEIFYEDAGLRNKLFSGSVSRFSNATQVLSKLEITGSIHFKITGRRIVVTR